MPEQTLATDFVFPVLDVFAFYAANYLPFTY